MRDRMDVLEGQDSRPKRTGWKKKGEVYCARCSSQWDKHWLKCQRCGSTLSEEAK